ncbi:M20/M25/M40 family metallo-hydrolase [Bacillus halotolerans]|uniref:M20/M25/M40 family metallo-hydrolase n=1 Tax=Bacillus halotolerans TaxID=260554 RepID=UPI002281E9D8|nr:M20/M25/M40 family metallo-hydrolase [Bacillus halotolerans]MCY8979234.1 M20/M25/M40 family metallo-hydrolase [Bacillus halotolerans]
MNKIQENQLKQVRDQIMEWVEQDEEKIVEIFSRLVQCETPSPPGDTREAMALVQSYLDAEGLPYKEVNAEETMPNIISSVQMSSEGRHLMFNGHLDVLPAGDEPGWTDDPWSGKIADGRVWGRGTSDMKAGVTAMLFAYTYLSRLREQLTGKLSLTLVSDEETGYGRGTGYMFEQIESEMEADCVLSAEPSGTDAISFASKGYMQFTVRVATRGAISGYPNESKSSIRIATDIIRDLDELEGIKVNVPPSIAGILSDPQQRERYDELRGKDSAEILPLITVNVGTIEGGSSPSVISPDCTFSVSVVLPVGTDPYVVFSKARDIVARYPEAKFEFEGVDSADVSDPESEMAIILQETVEGLGWTKPEMTPDVAMSDCRYWRYRGTPAFWYGPDGSNCSAANESVSIEELLHIVRTHALAAAQYLIKDHIEEDDTEGSTLTEKKTKFAVHNEIKSVPSVRVARITAKAKSFDDIDPVIGPLFDQLYHSLTEAGVSVGVPLATFEEDEDGDGYELIVAAAFSVGPEVVSGDGFEVVELPGFESAATRVHRGSESTDAAWNRLRRWISKQGYRPKEVYREFYIVAEPNPQELWATELQQLVTRR